jgi:hypothetical protein
VARSMRRHFAFLSTLFLTINVPRILKVQEIICFFAGKTHNGAFQGVKKVEKSQEMPHYVLCPRQKKNLLHFQNQRFIGIFMFQKRGGERERERESTRARTIARARARARTRARAKEKEKEKEDKDINVPPILKVRDIIFFSRAKQICNGAFRWVLRGGQSLFDP